MVRLDGVCKFAQLFCLLTNQLFNTWHQILCKGIIKSVTGGRKRPVLGPSMRSLAFRRSLPNTKDTPASVRCRLPGCRSVSYVVLYSIRLEAVRTVSGRGYIMPPMPGLPMGISGLSSFLSQITHSVVRNMPATEAAFSSATRVTLAGSTTPAARRSQKVSVLAL